MLLRNKPFIFLLFFVILRTISYAQNAPVGAKGKQQPEKAVQVPVFVYDAKGKRDPFMPLVMADGRIVNLESYGTNEGGIRIEGIIYDEGGFSYAIVNATIVKPGDCVGEYQLIEIQPKKIIFLKSNQRIEMGLREEK